MRSINVYRLKQVKEKDVPFFLDTETITNAGDSYFIVKTVLDLEHEAQEVFGIITLNIKHNVAGLHVLAVGTLNAVLVHPREVFKAVFMNNSAGFVCFHNHPSGDPTPSDEDKELTRVLKEGAQLLGIHFLDHIIIGENCYFSFYENSIF